VTEAGIINTILAHVPHAEPPAGPGDDAAALPPVPPGATRVLTTDVLVEGTHFLRSHPPEALGWKALAVNLSDVNAMGASAEAFTLTLGLPDDPARGDAAIDAWITAFARGLGACARAAGVVVVGGDTVRSGLVVIGISAWGVAAGAPLTRAGGRPGDVLLVAGPIGRAAAGLAAWLADPRPDRADLTTPTLAAQLRPTPPLDAGPRALALGARAAMDLSDGLATDLPRLAAASGVDLVVDLDRLPADPTILGVDPRARAAGGEDYGLVVLAPPERVADLVAAGFAPIGHAAPHEARAATGAAVIWRLHGEVVAPVRPAFRHFHDDA